MVHNKDKGTFHASAGQPGDTKITLWKDNKQAAFCLMFDDSIPSHVKTVVPQLSKRDLVGIFYINPGGTAWQQYAHAWEHELCATSGIVYANHTMTHKGARTVEELSDELKRCNEVIYNLVAGNTPRLISFGRPGVKKEQWTVTDAQLQELLNRYHLIARPSSSGRAAMRGLNTAEQMLQQVDEDLAQRRMGHILFHGVGEDWIITPTEVFTAFLDLLESRREHLWITDHICAHKYQTERDLAQVRLLSSKLEAGHIQLCLTTKADPAFYDIPLTLMTRVPATWQECEIVQKAAGISKLASKQWLQYDALPNGEPVTIRPMT